MPRHLEVLSYVKRLCCRGQCEEKSRVELQADHNGAHLEDSIRIRGSNASGSDYPQIISILKSKTSYFETLNLRVRDQLAIFFLESRSRINFSRKPCTFLALKLMPSS